MTKKYAPQLEGFSEEEYRQLEDLDAHASMKGALEFIDGFELDDEEEEDVKPARRARKRYELFAHFKASLAPTNVVVDRRSDSIESSSVASTAASEMGSLPPSPRSKVRGKAKYVLS